MSRKELSFDPLPPSSGDARQAIRGLEELLERNRSTLRDQLLRQAPAELIRRFPLVRPTGDRVSWINKSTLTPELADRLDLASDCKRAIYRACPWNGDSTHCPLSPDQIRSTYQAARHDAQNLTVGESAGEFDLHDVYVTMEADVLLHAETLENEFLNELDETDVRRAVRRDVNRLMAQRLLAALQAVGQALSPHPPPRVNE